MSAMTVILNACAAAIRVGGVDQVMIERVAPLKEDYPAGFGMVELTDVVSRPFQGAEGRIGRNPAATVMLHDVLVTALVCVNAATPEKCDAFRDSILMDVSAALANSRELRGISHRFFVSRTRFLRRERKANPEIAALIEFRVFYRARANDPATAIQPE